MNLLIFSAFQLFEIGHQPPQTTGSDSEMMNIRGRPVNGLVIKYWMDGDVVDSDPATWILDMPELLFVNLTRYGYIAPNNDRRSH